MSAEDIPQILKDAFDALRTPDEDKAHSFCLIEGTVDGEKRYIIAATVTDEDGDIETMIPVFQSLPLQGEIVIAGIAALPIFPDLNG